MNSKRDALTAPYNSRFTIYTFPTLAIVWVFSHIWTIMASVYADEWQREGWRREEGPFASGWVIVYRYTVAIQSGGNWHTILEHAYVSIIESSNTRVSYPRETHAQYTKGIYWQRLPRQVRDLIQNSIWRFRDAIVETRISMQPGSQ